MKQIHMFIIIFMSIGFVCIGGCSNQSGEEKPTYYYFPEKNVYYNVVENTYLYSLDGAKTWHIMPAALTKDTTLLGYKQVLYSDKDSIWLDNDQHRKEYNGKLYSIVDDDTTVTQKGPQVAERKVVKKSNSQLKRGKKSEEKKRPVKDFFKKLFGKKKKD